MAKQSEKTDIAVLGEKFTNLQKTVDRIETSMSKLADSGFVTRIEMQTAIKLAVDGFAEQLSGIEKTLDNQNRIGIGIVAFILISVATALLKLVLKI